MPDAHLMPNFLESVPDLDSDYLDMLDQAFLDGQINGEYLNLAWLWLVSIPSQSERSGA